MYDIVLFNNVADERFRYSGAYVLRTYLKELNYNVKIIDYFHHFFVDNYIIHWGELLAYLNTNEFKNVKVFGFSTTFLSYHLLDEKTKYKSLSEDALFFLKKLKTDHPDARIISGGYGIFTDVWKRNQFNDLHIHGHPETIIDDLIKSDKWQGNFATSPLKDATHSLHKNKTLFSGEDHILDGSVLPIEMSRGCRFKCKFCSFELLGRKATDQYIRDPEKISFEIGHNYHKWKITKYHFLCDTFNETTEKVQAIHDAIKKTNIEIEFTAYLRLELLARYPEQIKILKDMGLKNVQFGLETLHHPSGKIIGKGFSNEQVRDALEQCYEVWGDDVFTFSMFIIGLPEDTKDTVASWIKDLQNNKYKLSNWIARPLGLRDSINKSKHVRSVFDSFPTKYGYKFDKNGQWYNDHWTRKEAEVYSRSVNPDNTTGAWGKLGGKDNEGLKFYMHKLRDEINLSRQKLIDNNVPNNMISKKDNIRHKKNGERQNEH